MVQSAYEMLLADVIALTRKPGGTDFSRANLITLLRTLTVHLGSALNERLDSSDPDVEITETHAVCAQLLGLASALYDLDLGKTDPVLLRNPNGSPATRNWRLREADKMICVAVDAIQAQKKYRKRAKAAIKLASVLRQMGWKRDGKTLTAEQIEGIYKRFNTKLYSD